MTTPRTLDRYSPLCFKVLEKMRENGQHFVKFSTYLDANAIKLEMYKFRISLLHWAPDHPLADVARGMKIKQGRNDATLTFLQSARHRATMELAQSIEETEVPEEIKMADELEEYVKTHGLGGKPD